VHKAAKTVSNPPVELSGPLTVRQVEDVATVLCLALEKNSSQVLDLSGASEVDLSFVQAVESARVSAERAGGRLTLTRPAGGALLSVLERGGFLDPDSPERKAFWTQAEAQ
jgi:ABC-type transporter Mla MlaB component